MDCGRVLLVDEVKSGKTPHIKFELLVMKCYTIAHKEYCWLDRFRFFFILGLVSLGMDFGPRLGQQLRHVNGPRRDHECYEIF